MGVLVNVMSEYKSLNSANNEGFHIRQEGKAVGNRDDGLKKENMNILESMGVTPVTNYRKYFNKHKHVGYNAYKEEFGEGDFVLPRDGKDVTKMEGLIVCMPEKIYLKDLLKGNFDKKRIISFCKDYIKKFLRMDEKFKDCKILDAVLHMNEVYYPAFEETEEGRLRRLTEKEKRERAYVKPHMHIDYIPLVKAEKKGKEYLKLSRKEVWKSKGKYYDSYREFNDRCHKAVGESYGYERGAKWEDFSERVIKKANGEKVKEYKKMKDYQFDETVREYQQYELQLRNDIEELKKKRKEELDREQKEIEKREKELREEHKKIREYMRKNKIEEIEDKVVRELQAEVVRSIFETDEKGNILTGPDGNCIFTEHGENLYQGIVSKAFNVDLDRVKEHYMEMDILQYLRDNPSVMKDVYSQIEEMENGKEYQEEIR